MAGNRRRRSPVIFFLAALLHLFVSGNGADDCGFDAIFSFGDSIADTGNLVLSSPPGSLLVSRPPYGETFFRRPTGRFSDGRLIVDFIAENLGIPLLPAYLAGSGDDGGGFAKGVNFAVAGATALDGSYFAGKGMDAGAFTNLSLGVQLEWFKKLLPSLISSSSSSSSSEREGLLSRSLFLVGEIGGNDYNHPFSQGKTAAEIKTFVPDIVGAIAAAVACLVELGARTLVVPGNFPIGCSAMYLTRFRTSDASAYDPETGCILWLNDFAVYHNDLLEDELSRLRRSYPEATIVYADYYAAAMKLYHSSGPRNSSTTSPMAACCGRGGGAYNFDGGAMCGDPRAAACDDPSAYVSWDGVHLTESAYREIAGGLLHGPFADPPITGACKHAPSPSSPSSWMGWFWLLPGQSSLLGEALFVSGLMLVSVVFYIIYKQV